MADEDVGVPIQDKPITRQCLKLNPVDCVDVMFIVFETPDIMVAV